MQYLDIITTILGLIYIWLEYRASIWLWLFGIVMPALDIALYWSHGLYGDAGMAVYYTIAWAGTWYVLKTFTNSTVPVLDAFTNALSFVGLWALARKYVEQWFFWIVVDVVCCYLYVGKGIPFKAALYGLYVVIAVAGYFKWRKKVVSQKKIVILPSKS